MQRQVMERGPDHLKGHGHQGCECYSSQMTRDTDITYMSKRRSHIVRL